MNKIKKVIEIINYNIKTLIGFECAFKICTFFIFTPLFLRTFDLIMKITGYNYLALENLSSFLLNPLTIFMLIILSLLMMAYTMFDITTIIVILDSSFQKKKIKAIDAVKITLQKCKNILKMKNIPLAFLVLFLIPFLHIGISSSFITTIKIPEFILEFVLKNKMLFPLAFLLIIFLIILLLKWLYAIHYFLLEDCTFKEARKKSIALGKKKRFQDLFTLFLIQTASALLYLFFLILGIFVAIFLSNVFESIILLKSFVTTVTWGLMTLLGMFILGISTPMSYAGISVMYYFHKMEKKEKIKHIALKNQKKMKTKNLKKVFIGIGITSLIFGTIFTYRMYLGEYNLNIEYAKTIEVTAHRGASANYPENTMRAFVGAKDLGADWIELDVQQTKDNKIIIIHDKNLKRTTGVNKNTKELSYEEIKNLDAGSFFDKTYEGEKIPLLEEVIEFAKVNNMKLNIELKPTGEEIDFVGKVIEIIKKYHFEENCVLASSNYNILEEVKKEDANMKTLYVMSLAYGNITELQSADAFSIESTSITSSLVSHIHKEGKKIQAWTVNTEESIQKMIDLNVDNIITDNVTLARNTIYSNKTSDFIKEYIKWLESLF